ncbi:MAG: hypothetical protein PHW33_03095 [Candidatus Portnoybacteria bacterium]|nr:hypothetical protein [Candidatus Portnoybacteria bacterium]
MKFMRQSTGVTLIELVLTIVVISFGLIGVMILFENATRGVMQADLNVMATNLAHEKLEQIILDKWRDGYASVIDSGYPDENFQDEFSIFTRSTDIVEVSGSDLATQEADSGYKRVDVTVSWGGGSLQHISLSTLLASYK